MNLSVERLRMLVAVDQHGTLAAAARELSISPSAVSQQLTILERDVGGELLVRNGRSVSFTALGSVVLNVAHSVLSELERAETTIEAHLGAFGGPYTIAALPSVALSIVSSASAALAHSHPHLDLKIVDAEAGMSISRLIGQAVDMAIIDSYDEVPLVLPDGVDRVTLGTEPLLALVPASFVEPGQQSIRLEHLAELPWVLPPDDVACGIAARQACRRAGFEPIVRWESDDLLLLREYVAAGLGAVVLPRLALHGTPDTTLALAIEGQQLQRRIDVITRSATAQRPHQDIVMAELRRASRHLLDADAKGRDRQGSRQR